MVGQTRVSSQTSGMELLQPEPAVRVLDRREDLDVRAALSAQGLEQADVGGAGVARDDRAARSRTQVTAGGEEAKAERRD